MPGLHENFGAFGLVSEGVAVNFWMVCFDAWVIAIPPFGKDAKDGGWPGRVLPWVAQNQAVIFALRKEILDFGCQIDEDEFGAAGGAVADS